MGISGLRPQRRLLRRSFPPGITLTDQPAWPDQMGDVTIDRALEPSLHHHSSSAVAVSELVDLALDPS